MRLFIFFGIFLSSFCFNANGQLKPQDIIGEWQTMFKNCNDNRILTITDSNIISGSPNILLLNHSYLISESFSRDGSITLKLFDTMASQNGGASYYELGGNNADSVKVSLFFENQILVMLYWKGGDRSGEYSVLAAFIRKNETEPVNYSPNIRSVFFLPEGFSGFSWIALEQPSGEPAEFDEKGRRVLRIPESGLLLTQAKPMPVALAKREFAFYFDNNDGVSNESIPIIPEDCLSMLRFQNLSDQEITEYGYDLNQTYVNVYRYNNPGREGINQLFGRAINGQVLWFQVDTLRNLIKSGDMGF